MPSQSSQKLTSVEPAAPHPETKARLAELFADFGFRTFGERIATWKSGPAAAPVWQDDYRTIDTPEKLREFAAALRQQSLISLDTETTHISPRWAELVGLSFAWEPGIAYYLPVRAPEGAPKLDLAKTLAALRPVHQPPHGFGRRLAPCQNFRHLSGDGQLDTMARAQLERRRSRRDPLRHHARAGENGRERPSAAELEANVSIPAQASRACQNQIAEATEPCEGFAPAAHGG